MLDSIRQITIAEVMLLFVLLFVVPITATLLLRLRRYEAQFGQLKGKAKKAAPAAAAPAAKAAEDDVPKNVYPYRSRPFLTAPEKDCLAALREALGDQVEVYPKVALWETVESSDANPGFARRLHDKDFDFLVCDFRTGQPLTAVMFKPAKGKPAGPIDEIKRICEAAGANVVFIDQAEDYDAAKLKAELGLPDLEL